MAVRQAVPAVLGLRAESVLDDLTQRLVRDLEHVPDGDFERVGPTGVTVARTVRHVAVSLERQGRAWRDRVDVEPDPVLLHTFGDDQPGGEVAPAPSPAYLRAALVRAAATVREALGTVRQDDWTWPMWSPLGGTESLAASVRRAVAHVHVHRYDVTRALGRPWSAIEDHEVLAVEFVLEAIARSTPPGTGPMTFTVVTGMPGAGTWTLPLGRPHDDDTDRVRRGATLDARCTVRGPGGEIWRAAFGRGGSWGELTLHGDDEARREWHRVIRRVTDDGGGLRARA